MHTLTDKLLMQLGNIGIYFTDELMMYAPSGLLSPVGIITYRVVIYQQGMFILMALHCPFWHETRAKCRTNVCSENDDNIDDAEHNDDDDDDYDWHHL